MMNVRQQTTMLEQSNAVSAEKLFTSQIHGCTLQNSIKTMVECVPQQALFQPELPERPMRVADHAVVLQSEFAIPGLTGDIGRIPLIQDQKHSTATFMSQQYPEKADYIQPVMGEAIQMRSNAQGRTLPVQTDLKYPFSYRSTNYRRDLVWRPLIRLFRRWLKKDALSIETYEGIREECITRQGYMFCKALGLSEEISTQPRCQMAILLMVSSHRIIRRKRLNPLVQEMMEPFANELWPVYYKIFNETSNKQRVRFFNETLVQVLWGKFLVANADQILQYLNRVQTDYFFSP